jgi:hypothetical protein
LQPTKQELDASSQNPASGSQQRWLVLGKKEKQMNSVIWLNDDSLRLATEEVMFKFQDLEITRNTLVIRFF